LTTVFKEVGLVGFIFVVCTTIFFLWGTKGQKEEFVDRFILLKNPNDDPFPCIIVVVFLLLILVLITIYNRKMLQLRKDENNRLGEEKSRLQEMLLKRNLNSSQDEDD